MTQQRQDDDEGRLFGLLPETVNALVEVIAAAREMYGTDVAHALWKRSRLPDPDNLPDVPDTVTH